MIRALWYFLIAAVAAIAAAFIAEQKGALTLTIGSTEIATTFPVAAGAIAVLVVIVLVSYRLITLFLDAPGRTAAWRRRRRDTRGAQAVARGLVAVAAGDRREGLRYAQAARGLLRDAPLARLLAAQAAQLDGDDKAVETHYTAMLDDPETAFLATRGLFMQALKRNDFASARVHAERAFALRPRAPWVVNALFDLASGRRDWPGAARALEAQGKAKLIDDSIARRRRAVLLTAEAQDDDVAGHADSALQRALAALQLAPGLAPAAVLAAQKLKAEGRGWKAAGIIEAAWAQAPHPDLAALYAGLKTEETAEQRARRFAGLIELNPEHPESRLLDAAQAAAVRDFARARAAIAPLLSPAPTARVCALMADIAQGEGDAQEARSWIARSVRAPRDAYWLCGSCGQPSARWMPVCSGCQGFDTLQWKAPAEPVLARLGAPEQSAEARDEELARLLYRQGPALAAPAPHGPMPAAPPDAEATPPLPRAANEPVIFSAPRPPDDPGPDADEMAEPAPPPWPRVRPV